MKTTFSDFKKNVLSKAISKPVSVFHHFFLKIVNITYATSNLEYAIYTIQKIIIIMFDTSTSIVLTT